MPTASLQFEASITLLDFSINELHDELALHLPGIYKRQKEAGGGQLPKPGEYDLVMGVRMAEAASQVGANRLSNV